MFADFVKAIVLFFKNDIVFLNVIAIIYLHLILKYSNFEMNLIGTVHNFRFYMYQLCNFSKYFLKKCQAKMSFL